jgi:hypothetical protein
MYVSFFKETLDFFKASVFVKMVTNGTRIILKGKRNQ